MTLHLKPPFKLSIIVPCYNEAAMVPLFHARLAAALAQTGLACEVIYVDDGSSDGTFSALLELPSGGLSLNLIGLSRNFSKESAMLAGVEAASGEAVVIIDADLQDPPELIIDMCEKWRSGADVVYAVRRSRRQDSLFKRGTAALFYRLFDRLSDFDVPHNAGDFRLLSRRAVDAVLRLPERTRFSKGIFAWIGFPAVPVYFDRPARAAGYSKWNVARLIGLSLQAVTSFSIAPLRLAGLTGVVTAAAAGLYGLAIIVRTLINGSDAPGYPSLMAAIIFFAGVQLLFLGVLGEYVGRIFMEVKQRPHYLIGRQVSLPPVAAERGRVPGALVDR